MPIKSIHGSATERFPSLGILRKGAPKTEANKPGRDLQFFRFSNPSRPELEVLFRELYGEQPAELHVYLPGRTLNDNYSYYMEEWVAGGLQHRCDGETCNIWLGEDKHYHRESKPCPGGCKPVGRLSLILPELWKAGHVGYVTMETHSLHDIMNIQAALMATFDSRGDNPLGLRGIEFVLRRMPEEISVPGFGQNAGKRQHVEKWLVRLEPAQDWVLLQLASARAQTMMLEPGEVVDAETGEVLDAPWEEEPEPAKVEPVKVEPPKAEPPQHWTQSDKVTSIFWKWTSEELGLTMIDVLRALGKIGRLADYTGTQKEARALILQYIEAQAEDAAMEERALVPADAEEVPF